MPSKSSAKKSARWRSAPLRKGLQYLVVFVGGNIMITVSAMLANPATTAQPNALSPTTIWLTCLSAIIYGLGLAILTGLFLGSRQGGKPIAVAGLTAAVLSLITSLTSWPLALTGLDTTLSVTSTLVIVNVIYGLFYVFGWALAKREAAE